MVFRAACILGDLGASSWVDKMFVLKVYRKIESSPSFRDELSNKLESIQKRALYIIYPCHSYLDALNTSNLSSLRDKLSSAVNIFRRRLKMTTPLTSSSREQQLVVIVTTCRPATIEILFTLIGVVAGPSVQDPLFHSLVNI